MKSSLRAFVAVAIGLLMVPAAQARLSGVPVKVRLAGPPREVSAGETLDARILVEAAAPVTLSELSISGEGWRVVDPPFPESRVLAADEVVEIPFRALAVEPGRPLSISCLVDGKRFTRVIDVPNSASELIARRPAREDDPQPAIDFPLVSRPNSFGPYDPPSEESRRPHDDPNGAPDPEDPVLASGSRSIRVFGRVVFDRFYEVDGLAKRSTQGVYGATVRVYDEDSTWDEFLGSSVTDGGGYFDFQVRWDPCWTCDSRPDVYIEVYASNAVIQIQDSTWEANYSWKSSVRDDFTGSEIYYHNFAPRRESDMPALFMCDRFMRGWDRMREEYGYTIPDFDVQWPDGNHAYYNWLFEEIHIGRPREWDEGTLWHEMGHHWMEHFSFYQFSDYCNGVCDQEVDDWYIPDFLEDCGHCMWCAENASDAINEGFPNFIAWVLGDALGDQIPGGLFSLRSMESIGPCQDSLGELCDCDPWRTEGFLSAFLQDLADHTLNESHGVFHSEWCDRLSGLDHEIFDVQDGFGTGPLGITLYPTSPADFLLGFRMLYPDLTTGWRGEHFWETAANCGLDYDTTAPGRVLSVSSVTHPAGVAVTDRYPVLRWQHATDDASGIGYYGYSITESPKPPGTGGPTSIVRGDEVEIGPIAAGSWYFNIRAYDRAGNASPDYVTYGPMVVRDLMPGDLVFGRNPGWAAEVVPRPNPDAGIDNVPMPSQLNRAPAVTYWNFHGENRGETVTSSFQNQIYVDGKRVWQGEQAGVDSREEFQARNLGPTAVRGGRHSVTVLLDSPSRIGESDETNNRYVRQWVWQPDGVGPGATLVRSSGPPAPSAGWSTSQTMPAWPNCDGLSFQTLGGWDALVLHATADSSDLDLNLHNPTYTPLSGFDQVRASSDRGPGEIELVLVNGRSTGLATWYAGVVRAGETDSGYEAHHERASLVVYDQPEALAFAEGEYAKLRYFETTSTLGEWVTIRVTTTPVRARVRVAWFGPLFVLGSLAHAGATAVTNASGVAELTVFSSTNASNGIVLYRDPNDVSGPVTAVLDVHRTPADFTVATPTGWYAPIVPRSYHAETPTFVARPDTLIGGGLLGPYTYFNLMIRNDGRINALSVHSGISVDGAPYSAHYIWPLVFAGGQYVANWNQGFAIRWGRHTVTLAQDPGGLWVEKSEANNAYAEQFVWGASTHPLATPGYVKAPPDRTGGWIDLTPASPRWYNCVGYRTPVFDPASTRWGGFAIIPRDTTDIDVRLHEVSAGAKDGFSNPLVHSAWGPGRSDFVLVNFNRTAHRAFDVGMVNFGGEQSFQYESVQSSFRGEATRGLTVGPFTIPSLYIVQLHEFQLEPGHYSLRLRNLAGTVDWGFSVHGPEAIYHAKGSQLLGGVSWLAPAGADETSTVYVPVAGRYCVAVWKSADADRLLEGTYELEFVDSVTDAPPTPAPSHTGLVAIEPNPFNPSTTVIFDLARTGRADLEVFDLRGKRIRRLSTGEFAAGRQAIVWNGRDDEGREVASGVYVFRLRADGVADHRKAVLVK